MNNDCCAVCGKRLFQNGKRLTKLCYYIGVGLLKIDDNGYSAEGTLGGMCICKECFSEKKKLIAALRKLIGDNKKLLELLNRSNMWLAEEQLKNAELEKQIEKMKCCGNCEHFNFDTPNYCNKGVLRKRQHVCSQWELAE